MSAVAGVQLIPVRVGDSEVAKSTAEMIDRTGTAIRPDRVDVEFVTLGYDVASRARGRRAASPGGRFIVTAGPCPGI